MHVWRARLERWFTPLARRVPMSPNQITLLALFMNVLAATVLAFAGRDARLFLVAPCLLAAGGILDALDGVVARARHEESRAGDLLDHFCDRVSDLCLVAAWCLGAAIRMPIALASLIAVMLNGYAGTQIEATYRQRSYEGTGRGEFILALVAIPILAFSLERVGILHQTFGPLTPAEWMTALLGAAALLGAVQRVRRAMRLPDER